MRVGEVDTFHSIFDNQTKKAEQVWLNEISLDILIIKTKLKA